MTNELLFSNCMGWKFLSECVKLKPSLIFARVINKNLKRGENNTLKIVNHTEWVENVSLKCKT